MYENQIDFLRVEEASMNHPNEIAVSRTGTLHISDHLRPGLVGREQGAWSAW